MTLRILLANSGMSYNGGTQAWIRQMQRTLSANHEVHLYSGDGEHGGLTPFDPSLFYDVALINHWPSMQALRSAEIGKRVFTSHGVLPYEEVPVLGADAYVGVSEAVTRRIPFPAALIRNPIDFAHFRPVQELSPTPQRIAFVSNRQGRALPVLQEVCTVEGLELRVVGRETAVSDPQEVYQWADVVVGIARVAMEATAAGRNVLCFDYQGYHGMVTEETLPTLWASNFGGHTEGSWPDASQIAEDLHAAYDPRRSLRAALKAQHDPHGVAEAYLDLARSTPRRRTAAAVRQGPRQLSSPKITRALQKARSFSPGPSGQAGRAVPARLPR